MPAQAEPPARPGGSFFFIQLGSVHQGGIINHIFGKIQFLRGLLDGILSAQTLLHKLPHSFRGIIGSGDLLFLHGSAGDHQNEFALGRGGTVLSHGFAQGGAHHFFVKLCQFPAKADPPVGAKTTNYTLSPFHLK